MPEIHISRIQVINTSASGGLEGFKAHAVFQEINKKLQEDGEQFVKKIGGVFAFKVKGGPNGQEATWFVDVKNGKGSVHNDTAKKADCTISISDIDLLDLMTGKMNPQTSPVDVAASHFGSALLVTVPASPSWLMWNSVLHIFML